MAIEDDAMVDMSLNHVTLLYDTIKEFNVDSNLEDEIKTNKRQCPLSSVQVKIRECSRLVHILQEAD